MTDTFSKTHQTMSTDGGPHPADKWALITARHIFQIGNTVAGDRLLEAQKFQLALAELLEPHHAAHQVEVRGKLSAVGDAHLDAPYEPLSRAQQTVAAIVELAKGTPWEAHFARSDVQSVCVQEIGNHFATSDNIERQWHCHRNPDSAAAKAFLAASHPAAA